jgi:sulfite oxidase
MSPWGKRDDMIVHEADPYNAEPPRAGLADQVLTPVGSFYSRNHGPVPVIEAGAWRLRVDGRVERELELSLADLRARFEPRTLVATLQCAGNRRAGLAAVRDIPGEAPWGPGATSTAAWTGASLADVLAAAGLRPGGAHAAFAAPDVSQDAEPSQPYGSSITVRKALAGEVLLAWAMNGQPLTAVHGAPVRVVVPGYIGARSVKWVQRVTLQPGPSDNYFQAVAYRLLPADFAPAKVGPGAGFPLGSVAVNADILRPDDGATLRPGPAEVTGYAFAGDDRGICRVDVSLDGGRSWRQAELGEEISPWAWRCWRITVHLAAGHSEIVARAWDSSAATQPESPAQLWNPKGYVNNSWARISVAVQALPGRCCAKLSPQGIRGPDRPSRTPAARPCRALGRRACRA